MQPILFFFSNGVLAKGGPTAPMHVLQYLLLKSLPENCSLVTCLKNKLISCSENQMRGMYS